MLTVIIDNRIKLRINQASKDLSELLAQIKRDMTIPNPAFLEAEKYNRSTRGIPRYLVLFNYDQVTKELSLPRGYAGHLIGLLKKYSIEYNLIDKRTMLNKVPFNSQIKLRPYQVPAVEAVLKGTQGILEAPAGSGKTEMGLEIVARVGQPTLWLTHTKDLAEQAISRAEARLGIPRDEIGLLGAGQERIGDRFTVGIIQKLLRMDLAPLINRRFGLILLDECHHSPAATWSEIINQFHARYRYGVTATLKRGDSLEVITHYIIGPTLYQVSRSAVEASSGVIVPKLKVIRTGIESEVWLKYQERDKAWKEIRKQYRERGMKEPQKPLAPYTDILREILKLPERNNLIIQVLARECPGHYSLVLSKRVEHCRRIASLLVDAAPSLKIAVIHGKMSKKQRENIIEQMKNGELNVLFAVNIAKEGLDIPRLDRLFLVCSGRNEAEVEQMVGRIQRTFPGKKDAVVFDFVDEKIGMFQAQHWARRRVYKKLGMIPGKSKKEAIS